MAATPPPAKRCKLHAAVGLSRPEKSQVAFGQKESHSEKGQCVFHFVGMVLMPFTSSYLENISFDKHALSQTSNQLH